MIVVIDGLEKRIVYRAFPRSGFINDVVHARIIKIPEASFRPSAVGGVSVILRVYRRFEPQALSTRLFANRGKKLLGRADDRRSRLDLYHLVQLFDRFGASAHLAQREAEIILVLLARLEIRGDVPAKIGNGVLVVFFLIVAETRVIAGVVFVRVGREARANFFTRV